MDRIFMIHGGETVARISCDMAHTHEIFHSLPQVDYIVASEPSGFILWVRDGMTDEVWSPDGVTTAKTRENTFQRYPELRGVW
jgi:hypothetical protein